MTDACTARDRDPMPLIANLELTNRCNLRCAYCANRHMKRPRADMSTQTLELVMDRIDEAGIRQVILNTIGETLLAPQLRAALRASKARNLQVVVSTNGQLLTEEVSHWLLSEGCDIIRISVNAAETGTYDRLHEGGSFETLVRNVKILREARQATGVACVIRVRSVLPLAPESRQENRRDLTDFWSRRVDQVEFVTFGNMGGRNGEEPMKDERRVRCATMWRGFNVLLDGSISYCPCDFDGALRVGSLRESSFREVWESMAFRAVRNAHSEVAFDRFDACERCDATRRSWYELKEPSVSAREADIMDAYLHGWRRAQGEGKGE